MSRSFFHATRLGLGAVVVAAGIAAATSPAQAASCTIKGTTPRQLDVQMTANNIVLENINGQIIVGELGKPGFVCAARSALDKVTVRSANGPGFDQVIVDETFTKWGNLPLFAFTGSGGDNMVVNGSGGPDQYFTLNGLGAEIDLDGDHRADFHSTLVGTITMNGNGGNDTLSGSAFTTPGFSSATTAKVDLRGQAGKDTLSAGLSGRDVLDGGLDDDKVNTHNTKVIDRATGGSGFDFIAGDTADSATGFETGGIGGAKPGVIRPRAGRAARVKIAWSHPVSWRELRRLTLTASRKDKPVGSVTLWPRTGRTSDRGALDVVERGPIAHTGKRVSTTLELRVRPPLAGEKLDLRLEPAGR